jgi:hypothetical protein
MRLTRPRLRRPSAPLVISLLALFVALGGPAQAARLINGNSIKPGTIGSKQLKDRSIKPRDLAASTIRVLTDTANDSITAAKLGENSVTTRALAPGSVMTGSVADNNLTAADLASNSVGTDEVADNAIGQAEIRNNGVGALEIADQSIDGGEIIDGGLLARDVGRFSGTLIFNLSGIVPGTCQQATVAGTAADLADADISNDLIVMQPGSGWPIELTYGVTNAPANDQFVIYACNPTSKTSKPVSVTFRYVIIGFG